MNTTCKKQRSIILSGLPGVGKSTIGKLLAETLNYSFYDLDNVVAQSLNEPHSRAVIEKYGLEFFRKASSENLHELIQNSSKILSLLLVVEQSQEQAVLLLKKIKSL